MSSSATWLSEERPLAGIALQQVRRILDRSRRRPILTIGVAIVLASLLFALQARRPKSYHAEVGLVITEGVLADDGRPRPRGELRGLIENVIFASSRLEKLVEKDDLLNRLGGSSKEAVVTAVKRLIDVEVWQDYFESYRGSDDPPRSAHVTIGFSGPDPGTALTVARNLGEILAEAQTARESDATAARLEALRAMAESAAARAAIQHAQAAADPLKASKRPNLVGGIRLHEATQATRSADAAAQAVAAALFDAQLQARRFRSSGHLVRILDPGVSTWQSLPGRRRLVLQGVLSLAVAMLVSIILVGTHDPTVRDEQDLRRAGLQPLGQVPVWLNRHPSGKV